VKVVSVLVLGSKCIPEPHGEARPTVEQGLEDAHGVGVGPFRNDVSEWLTGIRKRESGHGLGGLLPFHWNHCDLLEHESIEISMINRFIGH